MVVVTARVHASVDRARELEAGVFRHRQRIHVCPKADGAARAEFQAGFAAGASDSPVSKILGRSPSMIEPCEVVAVAEGADYIAASYVGEGSHVEAIRAVIAQFGGRILAPYFGSSLLMGS